MDGDLGSSVGLEPARANNAVENRSHQNQKLSNDNVNNDNEPETQESQESFTQQILTQQGNELTQLGNWDDDDENGCGSQSQDNCSCTSPTPIDPLTLPWGRLIPSDGAVGGGGNSNGGGEGMRPSSSSGATDMLPRSPTRAGSVRSTRSSRSPSHPPPPCSAPVQPNSPCINFLGLRNLLASDRFNEYVLGRSVKVREE